MIGGESAPLLRPWTVVSVCAFVSPQLARKSRTEPPAATAGSCLLGASSRHGLPVWHISCLPVCTAARVGTKERAHCRRIREQALRSASWLASVWSITRTAGFRISIDGALGGFVLEIAVRVDP